MKRRTLLAGIALTMSGCLGSSESPESSENDTNASEESSNETVPGNEKSQESIQNSTQEPETAELTVHVPRDGMRVEVRDNFKDESPRVKIAHGKLRVTFELPTGSYSVSVNGLNQWVVLEDDQEVRFDQ